MKKKSKILLFLIAFVVFSSTEVNALVFDVESFPLEQQPAFSIINAQRYFMNLTTFPNGMRQTWTGYQFNITAKNIGSDATYVDMYIYQGVINNVYTSPPIIQTVYGKDEEGEFSTKLRFEKWTKNEITSALFDSDNLESEWIKIQFVVYSDSAYSDASQKQVTITYFKTFLSVSNSPFMYEYLEPYDGGWRWWGIIDNITIGGRLVNTTSGNGIRDETISIFYKRRIEGTEWLWSPWTFMTEVVTNGNGDYSYTWVPPVNRFKGSDVVYEIKVVWNQGDYSAVGFSNVFLPPKIPADSQSPALIYVAAGVIGATAMLTVAALFRRKKSKANLSLLNSSRREMMLEQDCL